MLIIDKYAYTNRLTNFNPMAKFIFAIGALVIAVAIDNLYINLLIFLLMMFFTIFAAKIPAGKYMKIISIPFSFLIVSITTILMSLSYKDVFIFSIKIKDIYIGITEYSIHQSVKTMMRVSASLASTFFLALTTSLYDIIRVLKKLKLPNTLIELFVLIYRAIFIFLEEAKEIYDAQEMKFGYEGFKNSCNSAALLIKCLLLKILIRYKDMTISLDSKLYDGEFRTGD